MTIELRALLIGNDGHAEFHAAVEHEYGHLQSYDNLKRIIIRGCRDLVLIPIGSDLDRAWSATAETAADEHAATNRPSIAVNLAAALIKLARIAPANSGPAAITGSFLIDANRANVSSRIKRLLALSESGQNTGLRLGSAPFWLLPIIVVSLLVLHFADQRLLLTTHEAIEHFVWLIQ